MNRPMLLMKTICLIALLFSVTLLTGCAGDLWLMNYRIKGGYYDRPSKRIPKTSENASYPH